MKNDLRITRRFQLALALLATALGLLAAPGLRAEATITVQVNEKGARISPTQYGIFYEEIERAGDGGLYAEMLQNRSFEAYRNGVGFDTRLNAGIMPVMDDPKNIPAWELSGAGKMTLDQSLPLNTNNPTALKITITGETALRNAGFLPPNKTSGLGVGLACVQGEPLDLSLYARRSDDFAGPIQVVLETKEGAAIAQATIAGVGTNWQQFKATLTPDRTDTTARLRLTVAGQGALWLDMVSLFPEKTFHNRPNGLRPDLAEMLAGLKPAFVRFPGGCFVEGLFQLKEAWRPLRTLGEVAARPGIPGARWQYGSTDGLGYHEMLQMCEDLGAQPLLAVNAGMSHADGALIHFTARGTLFTGMIDEALNAIEYANGDTTTKWGARRAANGHPAPFHLHYIEVGNEDGAFPDYPSRYAIFYQKIKEKYPEMHIIVASIRNPEEKPKDSPVEIMDEHYYQSVDWCLNNFHKYDSYPTNAPKVFIGEMGVTSDPSLGQSGDKIKLNNLGTALGEAVFWLGAERNSDRVNMTTFAPLLCRLDHKMWPANLIYFDQSRVFGSPSYYVLKLLGNNLGDVNLATASRSEPLKLNAGRRNATGKAPYSFPDSLYCTATLDETHHQVILKVVNFLGQAQATTISLPGVSEVEKNATVEFIAHSDLTALNSLDHPTTVAIQTAAIANAAPSFVYEFPPHSLSILRLTLR